jgi:hypothetical protein
MECVSPDHHPELRLRLAIETGEWDAAIRSVLDVENHDAKREAMRGGIAILSEKSEKSELMNRHVAKDQPVIGLLQGNALRDDDLKDMARDAELSARREALLTGALASGEPVPKLVMADYFRNLDLLPDKPRAIRIASDLAKQEFCQFNGRIDGVRGRSTHKVIAAEALILLGHGDLAFAAMRPIMEASADPHDFKGVNGGTAGGYTPVIVVGYKQATRIAGKEWPAEVQENRVEHLAAILGQADPLERARGMIALIARHAEGLETPDLLQALQLPFLDLSHAGKVSEDLKESARALFRNRKTDEGQKRWLESLWVSNSWARETFHPPLTGKASSSVTFTPEPGAKSDPRTSDFVIIDGLVSATKLRKHGKSGAARGLLRDIVLRLLLDSDTARQEVEWRLRRKTSAGSYSYGFDTRGLETVLCYLDTHHFPADLTSGLIDACANPWTNYADRDRLLFAARVLAGDGNLDASLSYYQRFLLLTVPGIGSRDTGSAGREEIAEMQRIRGMLAAGLGDATRTESSVLRLLQLTPYQPEHAADIAAVLRRKNDAATLKSARAVIDGYWQARLLEIPASKTYQYWKGQWEKAFP